MPLTTAQICLVVVASLGLGFLSWRFVEQPFRRPSQAFTQGRLFAVAASCVIVASLLGATTLHSKGFPARYPDFVQQKIPGHEEWKEGSCFLTDNPDYRKWSLADCTRIKTGPDKVLLWGDSFAAQYVPGIVANKDVLHATVIQYTAAGCPPVLSYRSYARGLCTAFNAHALEVIRDEDIKTVIVAGRWTDMQQRGLVQIRSTLDTLDKIGVRVILIGQSPEFAEDVQVISFLKGDKTALAINRWPVFFNPNINDQLAALAGTSRFINPMTALCEGVICPYQDKSAYLFEDYGHFSAAGSQRAVQRLFLKGQQSLLAKY